MRSRIGIMFTLLALCLTAVAGAAAAGLPEQAFDSEAGQAAFDAFEARFAAGELALDAERYLALSERCCGAYPQAAEHLALRFGLAHRLAGSGPGAFHAGEDNPLAGTRAWRSLQALTLLDAGDRESARALVPSEDEAGTDCLDTCRAAVGLARASLAFADAERDASERELRHALAALGDLSGVQRAGAAALADEIAELAVEISAYDIAGDALALAETSLAEALPAAHPYALRHHAGRFRLFANEGETRAASERRDLLESLAGNDLHQAAAVRRDIGDAVVGYFRAEYQAGADAAARAGSAIRSRLGDHAPRIAEALNVEALNYSSLDLNDEAIDRHRQALAIRETAFAPVHPLISESANNLSVVFHNIGRYDLAETFVRRSLDIDRAFYGEDNEEVASALSNLAAVYRAMGDTDRAIDMLRQSLAINRRVLGENHRRTAIMYHSLGQAYLESGDYELAWDALETSVAVHRGNDEQGRNIPIGLHNLTKAAIALGRHEFARETLLDVLKRYREIYGDHHRHLAAAHRELAEAHVGLGDTSAADRSLVTAASIAAPADAPEVQWRVFLALAEQERRLGHDASGVFFGKLALDVLQSLRASQTTLDRRLQRAFAQQRSDSYRTVAGWLLDADRLVEAQQVLDMLKDEEYFDFTRRQRFAASASVPFGALEATERERLAAARTQARAAAEPGDGVALYESVLRDVRQKLAQLGADTGTPAEIESDRVRPPAHAALVYYVVGDASTRVLLITGETRQSFALDIGRGDVARRVLHYRSLLSDPASAPQDTGRELYDALFAPLVPTLEREGIRSLALRLDGALRYLPFAALHSGREYLAERYELQLLHGAPARGPAAGRVAAFALTQAVEGFRALPAAAREADLIVRENDADGGAFPGRIWLDDAFDRDALQSALHAGYSMVHLASHFEFAPGHEFNSFLLLGNGERMTLYDLRTGDFPFDGVDLLTMSGCNTALSARAADGREMDGFATLAARKGAANILATLWPVEDAATADFMAEFYARRAAGDSPPAALRATQAGLRDRHPFYWAPFILWGGLEQGGAP